MSKNIVITGFGIISATEIKKIKHLDFQDFPYPVGEVDFSNKDLKRLLQIPDDKTISRTALLGIFAVKQAAENAGISHLTSNRIELISGTTVGGMDLTEKYWQDIDNHADVMTQHDGGSCTRVISEFFGFFYNETTISTACSSGANAILLGAELLKADKADIVFAGGAEALTKFHLSGFASLMILDKEVCRPFAPDRAGLNLGEGAAFLVMETEEHAKERGAKILCRFSGGGNACDAFHQTASSPNGEGAYLAMTKALKDARLSSEDIQYVNAHGTGTVNNDESETAALKRVFGENLPQIESTKNITGHTTSAAGAIEAVICVKKILENPAFKNVMDNSFGFGGNDTSLIFSSMECGHPCPPMGLSKKAYWNAGGSPASTCRADEPSASHLFRQSPPQIEVAAKVELTQEDEIDEIKKILKPAEYRRMGKLLKSSLLTSLKALKQSGITTPDAIITATKLGCWENSEKILDNLSEPKPTLFMQSTHNTIGSNIAIYLKCHGYNITYTDGFQSLDRALRDAKLLIESGKCKNVLVGLHEETTEKYRALMQNNGVNNLKSIYSLSFVLTKKL
ncbi:MAG: beta-ketoacyl-[acyl-carrier-protein] synthase family protein [Bacteroidales bacterium]|nr:beta-ketoacyl-[acyl-carrier-protein] synthase family protein [Bacteroidales bacterium]